jgi:signal transduction histidine kinase
MLLVLSAVANLDEAWSALWIIDLASCAGAAVSYRFPRSGAIVVAAGLVTWLLLPGVWPSITGLAFVINIFAAVRRGLAWRIPLAIALTVPGYMVMVERSADPSERAAPAVVVLFLLVLAWGAGELWVRGARLIQLERERAEVEAAELRLSLARDLHDTVAQTLSRVAMRSNVLVSDPALPDAARAELRHVADECRSSAHDLRQMLGSLRHGPGTGDDVEPASVESLNRIVADQTERLRAAGFTVESAIDLERLSAARASTLSAVTVEAANNILKHARASTACRIEIRRESEDVVARYSSVPGPDLGSRRERSRQGLGLVGIHERAALLGGSSHVRHGPRSWDLTVRLPAS